MATYCIGDLHGQDTLFNKLLLKIKFDPSVDTLYLLGDVIDRFGSGLSTLRYAMTHKNSITLLLGNHEEQFLSSTPLYDYLFTDQTALMLYRALVDHWSPNLYNKIQFDVKSYALKNQMAQLQEKPAIVKWLRDGGTMPNRRNLLTALCDYFSYLSGDPRLINHSFTALESLNCHYNGKLFVKDLLSQNYDLYCSIKQYVCSLEKETQVTVNGRVFTLVHERPSQNEITPGCRYIHGHFPIPPEIDDIHYDNWYGVTKFTFEKRSFFCWCNPMGAQLYNLDLGKKGSVGALRLEDFAEFYICKDSFEAIPDNKNTLETKYRYCNSYFQDDSIKKLDITNKPNGNFSFVSFVEGCFEFLIGVQASKKRILYSRVDLCRKPISDFSLIIRPSHKMMPVRIIENGYRKQSIEEIIALVRNDYKNSL